MAPPNKTTVFKTKLIKLIFNVKTVELKFSVPNVREIDRSIANPPVITDVILCMSINGGEGENCCRHKIVIRYFLTRQ